MLNIFIKNLEFILLCNFYDLNLIFIIYVLISNKVCSLILINKLNTQLVSTIYSIYFVILKTLNVP